jgi:Glucanosyltransferase
MRRSLSIFLLIALAGCGGAPYSTSVPNPIAQLRERNSDAPIFLKGVDYAPTPICSGPLDNPLGNKNSAIWKRDLKILRTLGVNAVKVYNANPNADPIGDFLNDAYNNGKDPIYVILSIFFPAKAALDNGAVNDLSDQYKRLAQVNGVYSAVIAMSISAEVNDENVRDNPSWWNGMSKIARAAREGFKNSGHPEKFITTTMVDDGFKTEKQGEKYNFPVDVWGINFYRGDTFGVAFSDYKKVSSKPLIVSEWGTPASWHPNGNPNKAIEFPGPKVHLLTSYVGGLAKEIWDNSLQNGGVAMGGFYFEYSDEWWKAGDNCIQLTNPNAPNEKFPGGYDDEAWFGLNSIAEGKPNVLTQRPTFAKLQEVWAKQ